MTIKKKSVAPAGEMEIQSILALSVDLMRNFTASNKSNSKLGNRYDVKIAHETVEQKELLESFYRTGKKIHPKLKAIIGGVK